MNMPSTEFFKTLAEKESSEERSILCSVHGISPDLADKLLVIESLAWKFKSGECLLKNAIHNFRSSESSLFTEKEFHGPRYAESITLQFQVNSWHDPKNSYGIFYPDSEITFPAEFTTPSMKEVMDELAQLKRWQTTANQLITNSTYGIYP